MASELYLIAHKVRGEPAFDVAERITIGDEEGWIIPTSGHRAYPYWHMALIDAVFNPIEHATDITDVPDMPPDLEDHYPIARAAEEPRPSPAGLLAKLGLRKAQPIVPRRV